MGDFSFMRSGHEMLEGQEPDMDVDFVRMVVSMMTILCEEAVHTAQKFVQMCGRSTISAQDTLIALKYESHFFWDKDIDERFVQRLQDERRHTYETDEDESSEDDAPSDEEEEAYTDSFVSGDRALYDVIMETSRKWDEWEPDDPVKRMLKCAIDKTACNFDDSPS